MEPSGRLPLARGRALVLDVLLAAGVTVVQIAGSVASQRIGASPTWRPLDGWA